MEKGTNFYLILASFTLVLIVLAQIGALPLASAAYAEDNSYEVNYSIPISGISNPTFAVQILKYEDYPVHAGDWFDVWVKVQNLGENDAPMAQFELQPEYPFSSNDSLVRQYGVIFGTEHAYKVDQKYDSGEVVLKYRVKVAENAPSGTATLKFRSTADANDKDSIGTITNLPIEISAANSAPAQPTYETASATDAPWLYAVIGFLSGFFLMVIIMIVRSKRQSSVAK